MNWLRKFSMISCFVTEFVLTFFFLMIIIGTTSKGAATGFAGEILDNGFRAIEGHNSAGVGDSVGQIDHVE